LNTKKNYFKNVGNQTVDGTQCKKTLWKSMGSINCLWLATFFKITSTEETHTCFGNFHFWVTYPFNNHSVGCKIAH